MAYMHKKTFDIYIEVYDAITPDDYFFVDDLIALPIQTLNRKGYITKFCCSGHPFNQHFQDEIIPYSDPIKYEREYYQVRCESYIAFNEGVVSLPTLPDGFNKGLSLSDELVIRKDYKYDGVDVYGIMPVIVESMKQLYEWTLSLPEYGSRNKTN